MDWQNVSLAAGGAIGCSVAIVHGVLLERLMIKPINQLLSPDKRMTTVRKLVPILLQFSTFNWFLSGCALIAAAFLLEGNARLAIGLLAGSSYLFAVIGNFVATRGRHPGWMMFGVALALVVVGLAPF